MWQSIGQLSRLAAIAVLVASLSGAARAASGPVDDAGLVARAEREGTLVYYASLSQAQSSAIAARFSAAYPAIKLQTLRAAPLELMSRVITEARAGLNAADVMDNAGLEIDQLKHQGLLASYQLPDRNAFLPGTVDQDGTWAAIFLNSEVIAYNPSTLSSLGLKAPTTWDAFASKEWRGNFGLPSESYEWWNAMRKFFGKDKADQMVRNYAANHPRLTSSHTIAVNDVATGDLPAAVNVYGYYALDQMTSGRPIAFVNPTPTVLEVQGVATLLHAPHPNAARLFARWLLSRETQQWVRDNLKRISARKDVGNDKRLFDPKIKYVLSNPDDSPAAGDLVKAFNAIFELPT